MKKKIKIVSLIFCIFIIMTSNNFAFNLKAPQIIETNEFGFLSHNKEYIINNYGNSYILKNKTVYDEMNQRVNEFTKQNYNFSGNITFAVDKKLLVKSIDHTDFKCVLTWTDGEKFNNKPNFSSPEFQISMASNQPILNYLLKQAYNPEVSKLKNEIEQYTKLRNLNLFPEDLRDLYLLSGDIEFAFSIQEDKENFFIEVFKNYNEKNLPIKQLRENFQQLTKQITLGIKIYSDINRFAIISEITTLVNNIKESIPFQIIDVRVIGTDWSYDDYKSIWGGPSF